MELVRKTFASVADAIAAQRVESFINGQPEGANTWDDLAEIPLDGIVKGVTLHISDTQETDRSGARRHIQMHRNGRVVVTFAYGHFSGQLLKTY